jgi:hypothetical protein
MAKPNEVLQMLCEGIEYVLRGENYEDVDWLGNTPAITKTQFQAGFAQYDAWKAEQDTTQAQAKLALLERLGLTQEEFNTLTA